MLFTSCNIQPNVQSLPINDQEPEHELRGHSPCVGLGEPILSSGSKKKDFALYSGGSGVVIGNGKKRDVFFTSVPLLSNPKIFKNHG